MIRISQIKLPLNHTIEDLENELEKILKLKNSEENFSYNIVKKSIDARKEAIKYIYSVDVKISNEKKYFKRIYNKNIMLTEPKEYKFQIPGKKNLSYPPVIIGSGPAGLFCGYLLSLEGYKPIIIERGEPIEKRTQTVNLFFQNNVLNLESNVQFGEGGAGTFSDGKLNTVVKDKYNRNNFVLETFVKFGANENILYEGKPHIGTDILSKIIVNMRNEIINNGGEFRFNTRLDNIKYNNNGLTSIEVTSNNITSTIDTNVCVLALGHSARDTFKMLYDNKIIMEPKAFAVGVRVEHIQDNINESQYGKYKTMLPAANYKLAKTLNNKRGVYSFCMCPGGYVVNASSEAESLAVNGMSYSKRDGLNANSAIVVSVSPQDFNDDSPLAGIEFQRNLEKLAYQEGSGYIPVQTLLDFKKNRTSNSFGKVLPQTKGNICPSNLRNVLPDYISNSIIEGMDLFANQIKDFNNDDTIISGVESRTSSPLRILRDERYQCNIKGIYPCGEGAGYAGGITSAAMDGMRVYEAIASIYAPLTY